VRPQSAASACRAVPQRNHCEQCLADVVGKTHGSVIRMISRMIGGQSPQKVAVVGCGIAGATLASELCARHPTATCHIFDMGPRGPGEIPGRQQADDPQHAW